MKHRNYQHFEKIKLYNIIKLVFGNMVIFMILFSICEIGLRSKGHGTYPGKRPNIEVTSGGKYFEKDSLLGYRHKAGKFNIKLNGEFEFTTTHDTSTRRLTSQNENYEDQIKPEMWIFGCSFTHGWSINDDETFPWLIQSHLSNVKIINWGVSGYGTIHFYLQLKEALINRVKPNLVIINHANFHFIRNTLSYGIERATSKWNFLGKVDRPYAKLDKKGIMHVLYSDFDYYPWEISKYSTLAFFFQKKYESYLDNKKEEERVEITKIILDKIVSLCHKNSVQLLLTNIGKDANFIGNYSSEKNTPFVDISVDLREDGNTNKPYDGHPSKKANKIYAKKLNTYLIEKSLLVE